MNSANSNHPRPNGFAVLGVLIFCLFLFFSFVSRGTGQAQDFSGSLRPAMALPQTPERTPAPSQAPLIELDGTISISPDGSELSYEWKQISGPEVELSDPRAAKPSFRTNRPGIYEFQLVVSANGLSSEPHTVRLEIERENLPPVAKIPAEAFGQVGAVLEVDGRDSFDPEGENLTYRWRPATPGLDIPLSALSMPILSFEPQADGVFEVELIVSDGEKVSKPAVCLLTIKPKPRPPVAQARIITVGAQQVASAQGKKAQAEPKKPARPIAQVKMVPPPNKEKGGVLTGTTPPMVSEQASASATSSSLTASALPSGLTASGLTPYASANGAATAGSQSIIGGSASAPSPAVAVSTSSATAAAADLALPPLPDTTDWTPSRLPPPPDVTSSAPTPVTPIAVPPLGAAHEPIPLYTQDPVITTAYSPVQPVEYPDADSLLASMPHTSSALLDPAPMAPPAQPAKPRYDVMSAPTTTLPFDRPRPTARIKGPKLAEVGKPVFLDARGSGNGLAGSLLDYAWRQTKGPEIKNIETLYSGAGKHFQAPKPGAYEFELVVTDGGVQSAPITHSIRFTDQPEPPIAVVVAPTRAQLGALITMDATQSYDLAGANLIYRWRQTGGPSVRNYVIDERLGDSAPSFYPPAPGMYSFELIVSNGKMNSRSVDIDIDVEAKLRAAPELSITGPDKALVGEKVTLAARVGGKDADREFGFAWRQKEGPSPALPPSTGTSATVAPAQAGRYVFEVTALENGIESAKAELRLNVEALGDGGGGGQSQQVRSDDAAKTPVRDTRTAASAAAPGAASAGAGRGGNRVPELTPLPNTPVVPPITSFPPPTLPDRGKGRPAAKVMQGGRQPPLADL